jgi:HrpA-like RNA helicase
LCRYASALRSLMELDAVDIHDELTPLGHHLAELPVDARRGCTRSIQFTYIPVALKRMVASLATEM